MKSIKILFVLVLFLASALAYAGHGDGDGGADDGGGRGGDGGERMVRWTLADWLAEKDQFRIEDQWLAMHRTAWWFALGLGGGQESYTLNASSKSTTQTLTDLDVNAFLSIFGLDYDYESSNENWTRQSIAAKLRLFGFQARSTYLDIGFGNRSWSFTNPSNSVNNNFLEAKLNLYIFKFFGVEAQYDNYMNAKASDSSTIGGDKFQYGAFVEVGFLRVGAREIMETTNVTPSGGALAKQTRNGTELELGFFF